MPGVRGRPPGPACAGRRFLVKERFRFRHPPRRSPTPMTDPTASAPAEEENFASMLENFCPSDRREVRPGERVRGRVLAVGKDLVYIDAGMKIDAVVERAELTDAEGNLLCAEGDELELFVTRVAEQEIRLSRAIAGTRSTNSSK